MDIQEYFQKMKIIQKSILEFLENEINIEENYQNLIKIFNDQNILDQRQELKSILYLLLKIVNNHYRSPNFLSKSEQILIFLKPKIEKHFTNFEIFNIFKGNKRILLFLFEEKIVKIDDSIISYMTKDKYLFSKYPQYFSPEFKPFIHETSINEKMDNLSINEVKQKCPEDFESKRKLGENDNFICQLIRKDSIKEFIDYIQKENISIKSIIKPSIYETNSFLLDKKTSLIEYSAFFGSIQIFKYLYLNGVDLKSSLWPFVIHGQNQEMIHMLEESCIGSKDNNYGICLKKAIKCPHNTIANYIKEVLINKEDECYFIENNFCKNIFAYCFHYYNFDLIPENLNSRFIFFYSCKYDYYTLVELLLAKEKIDLNATIVERPISNKKNLMKFQMKVLNENVFIYIIKLCF